MPGPLVNFVPGFRLLDGSDINAAFGLTAGLASNNAWTGTQDFTASSSIKDPNNVTTIFGGAAVGATLGTFTEEGNLYRASTAAAAGLGSNGADTTDDIICGIRLPAGVFDVAGRGLCITVQGKTGATTNNKRSKIFLAPTIASGSLSNGVYANAGTASGGTVIADTGAWVNATTPNNAVGFQLMTNLFKYGAAASNTQYAQYTLILGATHGGISTPVACTVTESGTIDIIVTGASYTTGAASDVVVNFFEVNAMN